MNAIPRPDTLEGHSLDNVLATCYQAAIAAVDPDRALTRALERDRTSARQQVWFVAVGKASPAMTRAALRYADTHSIPLAGGVIVSAEGGANPSPKILHLRAEHPEPGAGSAAAAAAVDRLAQSVQPGDSVWVLLSGGATSLLAAPAADSGMSDTELRTLFGLMLRAGLDIAATNTVRKRVAMWGAGRLAVALAAARAVTRCYVMSDVIDDDLAAIGSGPCAPDRTTASDVVDQLTAGGLWSEVPLSLRDYLQAVVAGRMPETPKPADPAFARVTHRIVASNADAVDAAASLAEDLGFAAEAVPEPIRGEAVQAAARFVERLERRSSSGRGPAPRCVIQGGETTVRLGDYQGGMGGRCQEFALAAAGRLASLDRTRSTWRLLAAGTDGRDGPTDAAGAIVSAGTWPAIRAAGRDPRVDLEGHNAYHALAAVGGLFKPGPTGTNVMDIVIALEAAVA